ncbi:MAG: hypothetical protein AAGB00_06300 [Planctomycetota bacterium]
MNFVHRIAGEPILDSASGSTDRNSEIVDTRGVAGVALVVHFGAVGGAGTLKLQGGHLANGSDMSDLHGTSTSFSGVDANAVIALEVGHSQFRYVRLVVSKGGNTVAESAIAYSHSADSEPVTHAAEFFGIHFHAPAVGTA